MAKPWAARSRKDKGARILLTPLLIAWVAYTVGSLGVATYDYYSAGDCSKTIKVGLANYEERASKVDTMREVSVVARDVAVMVRDFGSTVKNATCPTYVAGKQADFVAASERTANLLDRIALAPETFDSAEVGKSFAELQTSLTALKAVLP